MRKRVSAVGSQVSGKTHAKEVLTPDTRQPTPSEPNWGLIYAAVLGELTLLILIFYAFTKAFA
jgi:hypothetical protein